MSFDAVWLDRDLRRRGGRRPLDWFNWVVLAALATFSLYVFLWEFQNQNSDLYKHAVIASEFVFSDPHSITSRIAYPLWHMSVSALYQLGLPLSWAAALMCTLSKALLFLLVHRFLNVMTEERVPRAALTLITLALLLVTPIRIPGVNDNIYKGIGSPTVWHNPTQLAVLVTAMLCVPYTLHCWFEFQRLLPGAGQKTALPWRKVVILAALTMASLACKPTFMQALIPAAGVFFLVQWFRHPRNSRYFLQIVLAFLPAVGYFMLQYLYYTGVVVPYTSGVVFGTSPTQAWEAVRNMLLMAAFPLFALAASYRKGMFKDAALPLCLLMAGFSMLEATFFRETGIRLNHGNFNWASMSSAFFLWVVITPKFLLSIGEYREQLQRTQLAMTAGTLSSAALRKARFTLHLRSTAYFACFVLLVWHLYSGVYYLYYLFSTGSTF
ncbi:MAG: hypothetical protein LLF96_02455 [Eubacteriales bacterium]|nr:hypothetical protein [Eubacteriales bacterium]